MHAESVARTMWQYRPAVHSLWAAITGKRSGAGAGSRAQAGIGSRTVHGRHRSVTPTSVAVLLSAMAVLAITYAAAATLVDGAASHTDARANHATALQHAALDYRRARAGCQRLAQDRRSACAVEAHADEDRARAMASLAPASHRSALRSRTDAGIDAGDRDSIIVEPACSIISRGQASVCEIQVKSNAGSPPAEASPKRRLTNADESIQAGAGLPFVQARASTRDDPIRASMRVRADGETGQRETYRSNPAATSHRS
jgi:hypothetical protein